MGVENSLRAVGNMRGEYHFSRVQADTFDSKHCGAQDIRFQNDSFVVETDHPHRREIEVPEVSFLRLFREHASPCNSSFCISNST